MNAVSKREYLNRFRAEAESAGIPIVRREVETILLRTVERLAPTCILEIGTAVGYSGSAMLSVAPPACRLYTVEKNEDRVAEARRRFAEQGLADRVTVYEGDATEIVPYLTGRYDLIFLDGPKGQYLHYLPCLCDVLAEGGALVCDNLDFHGMVTEADLGHKNRTLRVNLLHFRKELQTRPDLQTSFYGVGDGVSVSVKRNRVR